MTKKRLTAEELLQQLANDPDYQRRAAEKEERIQKSQQRLDELDRPILAKLKSLGFPVASTDELVARYGPLPKGIVDVLLEHIAPGGDERHTAWLVRCLAAAGEPFDGRPLARLYESTWDEGIRYAIALAITMARPHSIDEWIEKMPEESSLKYDLKNLGYYRRKRASRSDRRKKS